MTVDPGHGGVDGGCHRPGLYEKHINLGVAQVLQANLTEMGADVLLTRNADVALVPLGPGRHRRDLQARIEMTGDFGSHIYLSLHVNSGPAHLGGALTFFRKGDSESERLAALIQEKLTPAVPGNQNGILPASFFVLSSLRIPAVLIEMGFLTNPDDRRILTAPGAEAVLASAIAGGVSAFARGETPVRPAISPFVPPEGFEDTDATLFRGCALEM